MVTIKKEVFFSKRKEKEFIFNRLVYAEDFTKNCFTYIFVEQFEEHLFAECLLVDPSKTRELEHVHLTSKRDSVSLAYKKLLK